MSQVHRRHGGRGSTLLYYIGLEGKEDRRTEEQKTEGQKNRKKGKGKGRQKNKNRWKGEQEQGGKRTEKDKRAGKRKDKRTGKRGHADRKKHVNFLRQPRSNLTEPLEQCSSYPVALLRSCRRKITEGVGNYAETHGTMPFCTPRKIFSAFCLADIKKTDTFATLLESTGV